MVAVLARRVVRHAHVVAVDQVPALPPVEQQQQQQNLNFPLLSDEDLAVHNAYGAYGEKSMYGKTVTGVLRSTFVVDEEGKVTLPLYNVKATGHVASLRKKLKLDA